MIKTEREDPMTKRISKKVKRSFKIKSTYDELEEVLAELLRTLDINELHIMTYKDNDGNVKTTNKDHMDYLLVGLTLTSLFILKLNIIISYQPLILTLISKH